MMSKDLSLTGDIKRMKKRQTNAPKDQSWDQIVRDLCWRNQSTLGAQHVYYRQLNRDVGLLHIVKR